MAFSLAQLVYHRLGLTLCEPIGADRVTIGRTESNLIQVQGTGVSREHCWVGRAGERFVLVDLGSSNGTLVNDVAVAPHTEHPLEAGDAIRVGEHTFTVVVGDPPAPAAQETEDRVPEDLGLLLDTIAELHQHLDPAALLPVIVDRVIRITGAERGLLLLHSAEGLETSVARNKNGDDIRRVDGTSRSVPEKVISTGLAVCITSTADMAQASSSMKEHDLRSILCVPIRQHGSVRGVIYVDSQEIATEFGAFEQQLLEALAAQCGVALERSLLHREELGERRRLEEENAALRKDGVARPLALAVAMKDVLRRLERVAGADVSLLLTGETGVGKEVLARYAHAMSPRRENKFVVVDCGAIPDALLESVLFGHVKGAFTSATSDQEGLVRRAEGGTLLLDEIGELPLALQPKLLRFLEERSFLPVGSGERQQADVRLIACTHRDLEAMATSGSFREDLYFRLNAFPISIPPLRERREEIVPLARFFLTRERQRGTGARLTAFTHEAEQALRAYRWPGNVRELSHRVQRASVVAQPPFVTVSDLDLAAAPDGAVGVLPLKTARKQATARFEQEYVSELLGRHGGRVQLAAKEAGVSRQMFQRLMARHGISRSTFKGEGKNSEG
jgi:transcriptional regulator with GAF, ATPase, and Fis domain